jgi:hypothetical protein
VYVSIAELDDSLVKAPEKKLDDYLRQLPVIGFNSGNYDLNVIKPFLVNYFVSQEKKPFSICCKAQQQFHVHFH